MATTQRVARFHPENWKQSETGNYIRWLPSNPPLALSFTCYRFYTSCTMGVFINVLQKILTISQYNPNATWTARNTRHAAEQIVVRRNWECLEDMCNAQHGGKCLGELHGWTANNNTLSGGTLTIPRIYSYLCMYVVSVWVPVRSAWFATMRDICANRANPGTHTAPSPSRYPICPRLM